MARKESLNHQITTHAWWAAAMGCILLCAAIWEYTVDDAYITFRYARNIAAGEGAVFNPGDRVEGFTSPLWLGVTAGAEILGLPAKHVAKTLGIGAVACLLWYVSRRVRSLHPGAQLPLLIIATHTPLIVGIVCGLETAINAVLLTCMLLSSHGVTARGGRASRKEPELGLAMALWGALALLCRPENGLLVGVHGLYLWSARPKQRRILYVAGALWLLVGAGLTGARFMYYGSVVPNTAIAKLGAETNVLPLAWHYCATWFEHHHWLLLFGVPALFSKNARSLAINGWVLIAAQVGFVFLAGGDWMPQWRFLLPVTLILVVVGCHSVDVTIAFARRFTLHDETDDDVDIAMGTATTIACFAGMLLLAGLQLWDFRTERWALDHSRRQLATLDAGPIEYLARNTGPTDVIAARDVGMLGWRTQCRILDLVGLTNKHIAETSGLRRRGALDLDYVFGQSPTFLMLQTEKDQETGEMALGRLSRLVACDPRFDQYRFCERWDLPGGHFCEVYRKLNTTLANGPSEP